MITFDPPELKQNFVGALRALNDFAEIELDDWPEMHEADFDFDDALDTVFTSDTEFAFDVGADEHPSLKMAELIALAAELPLSKVVDHSFYVSPSRAYVRVESANEEAHQFFNHLMHHRAESSRRFESCFGDFVFALVNGFTPFAIHMKKMGEYESDAYPTYDDHDLFVEIRFPTGTSFDAWRSLVPSFLFELDQELDLAFTQTPRPAYNDLWPEEYDESVYLQNLDAMRLRPLMGGPGVESLLRLYERALGRDGDAEQHFVGFIKVIEYVSATVVNTERNAQIRRRLLSPKALSPDANFIRDLGQLFESLRNFKKDSEALQLAIETCCDAVELARYAPPYLRALAAITELSKEPERRKALDALSATFSATRNMFSHAKANYALTGNECPEAELLQLTKCARIAAQQCARWFAHSDVSLRIID